MSSPPTMNSGASRPVAMKMRPDLIAKRQSYEGRDCWVIKDPIAIRYFRFEEEEYRLLQLLDGHNSPSEIKRKFEREFAPQKIELQEIFQLAGMLYRNSLLVSGASGQGESLLKRRLESEQSKRWQSLTNILAIRFRGFDPDSLLTALNPFTAWFFTWPAFFVVLMFGAAALSLIVTNFEAFQNKLPSFDNFFAAGNWLSLSIVLGITKVLHEFGHGLACKRFGGRCHEMGLMFLVLTPCLYANVSDSWLLKSKWQRAFIAAAGMYVELVIASIAVFVWWFSTPGIVHHLALNVVVVCSVSTLVFNANPLLRYDGYYILADLLEIPNLRQKSSAMLNRFAGGFFLGLKTAADPFAPSRRKWFFVSYSILAVLYRWLITFSIFWFVYRVLEPYGLKIFGQMLALMAIYGLVGMPLVKLYKFFSVPGRTSMVKPPRVAATLIVATGMLGAVMLIPIPRYVRGCFHVQAQGVASVYVQQPGVLTELYVQSSEIVSEGMPLMQLSSPEMDQQIENLKSAYFSAELDLEIARQTERSRVAGQMSAAQAQAALETAENNFRKKIAQKEQLVIRSTQSGLFLAGHRTPVPESDSGLLHGWHGTPLEPRNIGCALDRQTVIGQVVPDMKKLTAVLAIDQSEIEFVSPQQRVVLIPNQDRTKVLNSETGQMSPVEMKIVPPGLASRYGGSLITRQNPDGQDEPISTTFMVEVPLDLSAQEADVSVFPGSTGLARIRTGSQTVGQRLWRLVCQTFQFEL